MITARIKKFLAGQPNCAADGITITLGLLLIFFFTTLPIAAREKQRMAIIDLTAEAGVSAAVS